MSTLVIDASVAAKWFFPEEFAEVARHLGGPGNDLLATDLFMPELVSVLRKLVVSGDLSREAALEFARSARASNVRLCERCILHPWPPA